MYILENVLNIFFLYLYFNHSAMSVAQLMSLFYVTTYNKDCNNEILWDLNMFMLKQDTSRYLKYTHMHVHSCILLHYTFAWYSNAHNLSKVGVNYSFPSVTRMLSFR